DAHFQIAKRERDGRTITEVTELDREGRIVELGQMLGGSGGVPGDGGPRGGGGKGSDRGAGAGTAALASARELLDRAEAWRGDVLASS
ncbi:MAG TPA: hypothetical protein VK697_06150, partial [Methylomirabilota bacterium]|nr:hypothetical protein [Methylomirabilota bacterium]